MTATGTVSGFSRRLREMVRDFSRDHIAPVAGELDRTSEFPWENIKAMGELGLLGVPWGEELGGARGLLLYMQRTALQGDKPIVEAVARQEPITTTS